MPPLFGGTCRNARIFHCFWRSPGGSLVACVQCMDSTIFGRKSDCTPPDMGFVEINYMTRQEPRGDLVMDRAKKLDMVWQDGKTK